MCLLNKTLFIQAKRFKQKNINSIIVSFKYTKKNIHLRELLINLKFQEIAKNKFKLNLKNFKKLVTYIN